MSAMDCIFCNIANKVTKATILYEDEDAIVFPDINPKAAFHVLIVPKQHIESVHHLSEEHGGLAGKLLLVAQKVAKLHGLQGYQLHINVGRDGGQEIDHLHIHLLSNKAS